MLAKLKEVSMTYLFPDIFEYFLNYYESKCMNQVKKVDLRRVRRVGNLSRLIDVSKIERSVKDMYILPNILEIF